MVTTTKTTGFDGLCCPECGNESAIIMMDLMTLGEFRCEDCSETFTVVMSGEEGIRDARGLAEESSVSWNSPASSPPSDA
jgi:hypothetical protein